METFRARLNAFLKLLSVWISVARLYDVLQNQRLVLREVEVGLVRSVREKLENLLHFLSSGFLLLFLLLLKIVHEGIELALKSIELDFLFSLSVIPELKLEFFLLFLLHKLLDLLLQPLVLSILFCDD